ncbi:MAG: hypothetical protein HYZ28_08620 [Myxococcales bacterium]|nr:hypothetical protein [Myxococcales bacterium]
MRTRSHSRRTAYRRGQAMLEYSMLNWVLAVALILAGTVKIIPGARERQNLIELFLDAYQTYYDSFYYVLNVPFP